MSTGTQFRLAMAQFEPALLDKQSNLETLESFCHRAASDGVDVIAFPECVLTGYPTTPQLSQEVLALAERLSPQTLGDSVQRMVDVSRELNMSIVFGLPELDGEQVFNSAAIITPENGLIGSYRKTHLWEPDREFFSPGDSLPTFSTQPGTLGCTICFDHEFPETVRALALRGADFVVSPTATFSPWEQYQAVYARARAMENQIFFGVSNLVGSVEGTQFFGKSTIVDPYGKVLAEAGSGDEIVSADIDLSIRGAAQADLDYMGQRRPEIYSQ
jgi:predicted amidohydrolase